MSNAFKTGQLRDQVGKKGSSPSASTALESDGCFSIAASNLSIMPSFAAAIAAGVTSIAVTTLGLAELTAGHTVKSCDEAASASDATLSDYNSTALTFHCCAASSVFLRQDKLGEIIVHEFVKLQSTTRYGKCIVLITPVGTM